MTSDSLRRAASALALTIALSAAPASAQTSEQADKTAEDTIIVTAQKTNQTQVIRGGQVGILGDLTQVIRGGQVGILGDKPASDTPFSIKSYNAALILNQQPQTLGQVLENDPTIRTTYGFGNASEQFVIRGFTLFADDIALDGLYGITPRQLVAPELYEQVQVLNGASAFLNGAAPGGSAIGGSVNLIPKRAGNGDLTRATANYTSDKHFGGAFDVSRRFGDGAVGLRVNGVLRGGDVAIDDEYRRSIVLGGALDYRGTDVRLSLDLAYQQIKVRHLRPKVTIGSAAVPRVPRASHNYAQRFTYNTLRDVFGIARAEWDIAPNALAYAQFGARDGSERGIYDGITVNNAVTGAATGSALFVPRTDNNEAAQAGVRIKLASGGLTQEINLGGTYIWQVNRNAFDFLGGFTGFATNLYTTPQVARPGTGFVGGDLDDPFAIGRNRLGSAFVSDTFGLFDDRVLVTGGMRLQMIEQRGYSYVDGSRISRYRQDAVTPVVGVVVKPITGLSLFFNRIEGLQQGPTAPLDTTIVNPGQVFAPFKSIQYEAGGKLGLGHLNGSLAFFRTTLPSAYAVPLPTNPLLQIYGVFGKQRNQGIELSVDGEVAKGLRVIAGGSLIDAKLRRTLGGINEGNRAQGVPRWLANGNVEYDLPFLKGATLTGRVVYTGRQQVNNANTLSIPSWTRVDLGARYVALVGERPVTFRANVDNVANRRYWASAFDSFSNALLQGAPRTYKASVSIDF